MVDGEHKGRSGRFRFRWWQAILAVVAVLAGLVALRIWTISRNLEHRLEALRAAGCPTDFAELARYNTVPEGLPNAADVYTRAFAAFVPSADRGNSSFWGTADPPERGVALPEPMVRSMAECAAENEQCLTLLHEAAGIEHCRYEWDYRQQPPDLVVVGDCARLLQMNALLQAHRGQAAKAVASLEDGLCLGESLRTRPWMISYVARGYYDIRALAGLERVLSMVVLTDRQLEELSHKVATIANTPSLAEALITEQCLMLENCRRYSSPREPGSSVVLSWVPGARAWTCLDLLDWTQACIEAAGLPDRQRVARFRQIREEVESLSALHRIVKLVVPGMTQIAKRDLVFRAHLTLARTALALERHRLAAAGLPESLENLVPKYLERAPVDPFDGRPIRYKRTDPGYRLYSVFEDACDNGGRERDDKDRTAPYDLCFIVTR